MKTPTKDAKIEKREFNLFDDAPREESPDTIDSSTHVAEAEVDVELQELRKQFVGDVDITEGCAGLLHSRSISNTVLSLDQEPLLLESKRRFVLFPIQYPEVHTILHAPRPSLIRVYRSGRCTRRLRPPSGQQRRWTFQRISMTGITG